MWMNMRSWERVMEYNNPNIIYFFAATPPREAQQLLFALAVIAGV